MENNLLNSPNNILTSQIKDTNSNGTEAFVKKSVPKLDVSEFIMDEIKNEEIPPEETYEHEFQKYILDQNKEYPPPVSVVKLIQGANSFSFLTLKSFSLWQGKQKSKKTIVLTLAAAAFITGQPSMDLIRFERGIAGKILFFDTEQGESYGARTMKLILMLAGVKTTPNLIYFDLREVTPNDRFKIIEQAIENTPDVKLVVIDGIVDLMNDFMEAIEGHRIITNIIKLCSQYDIHIAGVLHQNKGDNNARAHVGSISSQKCEIEISAEVDKEDKARSIIKSVNTRDMPPEDFAIRWDKGSLPRIDQDWSEGTAKDAKDIKKIEDGKRIANGVFKLGVSLLYTEAIDSIKKFMKGASKSTAKRRLEYLEDLGLVKQEGDYYRSVGFKVHEGSNGVQ